MDQIALYRKYRPHNFENLVGQDHIKTTLSNALKSGHVSHAYLFSGPRGTGKTSTARLLAKALNCTALKDKFDPCNECEFCTDINEGKLIDLIEIDAASNRGIDEVRDLREKINFAPTRANYKIYIIDEVHMMTKEAFNALLKTLEEPPAHAYFILATTEIHKIPETIISRCQRFDFKRISRKALMTRLSYISQTEKIVAEDQALEAISKYVDGGLRDAIGLIEQLTTDGKLTFEHVKEILGVSDMGLLDELYEALDSQNTSESLRIIHELHDQGSDLKKFVYEFIDVLRNRMLESISKNQKAETVKLMFMIETFEDAQEKLHSVNIPQLPLEIAIIRITGPVERVEEIKIVEEKAEKKEIPKELTKNREHKSIPKEKSKEDEDKSETLEFNLESLKENWPRILERIQTPALRLSLKNAVPIEIEDSNITLQFNTKFHKDKVMEHDNRVELEKVIEEVTGSPSKILTVLKELEIKPVTEEESDVAEEDVAEEVEETFDSEKDVEKKKNFVDKALNIFGGEVVE